MIGTKFAILADIHGNTSALDAVLEDMRALGISNSVNLGDHFSGPLDASGTARRLIERDFVSIRGNHDRWLVEKHPADMGPSDRVAYAQLDGRQLEWLRSLPATSTLTEDVFLCHGTPSSDETYWLEKVDPDGSVRSARYHEIESEAKDIDATLMLCGHTHVPRLARLRDGRIVVNPGSVGCPGYVDDVPVYHRMQTGTPNASYSVAEKSRDGWLITFRSVPYDSRAMVDLARSNSREVWAQALETGWLLD